jgi:transcriptional regulator with PAS, ATPase and Fis domain
MNLFQKLKFWDRRHYKKAVTKKLFKFFLSWYNGSVERGEKNQEQGGDKRIGREILLIAPYEQMYRYAKTLVEDPRYQSIEVSLGNLTEGVALAVDGVESRMKVVISRGGTYRMIKQANIGVPLVEIRSSPYDMLESLSAAIETNLPLAIVGFSNIINNYDEGFLKKIVKNRLTIINLKDEDNVKSVIESCVREGYQVFLGDTIVKNMCEELGYTCYLQESGGSAIQAAMGEALRICSVLKQEQEFARRLRAVIDFVHDGVIALDGKGNIILFNAIAKKLLGVTQDTLGAPVDILSHLPFAQALKMGEKIVDQTFKTGEQLLSVSAIPVSMESDFFGSVVIIRDVRELQAYEQKLRVALSDRGFIARHTFNSIIYQSTEIAHCISIAKKFSHYDAAVLIEGESGVGKELFAQSIHNNSTRRKGPFVAINCAVLPKSLIESELFGYVEGAFTGSGRGGKAGYFEMAHRGALFLDEISELPLDVQAQFLRVIQEKKVMRLGDTKIIPIDIRLICATNKNLIDMVREGLFRKDLLFRINTLALYIPPLSQRKKDIEILSTHFLEQFCGIYDKSIKGFSLKAADYLGAHPYDGNVRELRNMIERAVIICDGSIIRLSDLQSGLREGEQKKEEAPAEAAPAALEELEKTHIQRVLVEHDRSMKKTAAALGISRSTLWRKINGFGI